MGEQQFPQLDHPRGGHSLPSGNHLVAIAERPPASRNPYLVYGKRLGPSSRSLLKCLDRIAQLFAAQAGQPDPGGEHFPWQHLRYEHTAAIRALLTQQTEAATDARKPWSPAYANKHRAALRGVLTTAWQIGLMTAEEHHRAADIKPIPGSRLPAGRSIAAAELAALLQACAKDPGPAGVRDAALIAALYSTGGRCSELASAQREHYDPGERALRLTGKGGKERLVYLQERAAELLGRWLAVAPGRSGPLFLNVDRWGNIGSASLSDEAIRRRVKVRRREAGLPGLTPHDFRRTFIGDLLDSGADLATAQGLAGHASPATTARYDRRPERTRKAAVDRLRVPTPTESV